MFSTIKDLHKAIRLAQKEFINSIEIWLETQPLTPKDRTHWLKVFKARNSAKMQAMLALYQFPLNKDLTSVRVGFPAIQAEGQSSTALVLAANAGHNSVYLQRSIYKVSSQTKNVTLTQLCGLVTLMEQLHILYECSSPLGVSVNLDELSFIESLLINLGLELSDVKAGDYKAFDFYDNRLTFVRELMEKAYQSIDGQLARYQAALDLRVFQFKDTLTFFTEQLHASFKTLPDSRNRFIRAVSRYLPWHQALIDLADNVLGANAYHPDLGTNKHMLDAMCMKFSSLHQQDDDFFTEFNTKKPVIEGAEKSLSESLKQKKQQEIHTTLPQNQITISFLNLNKLIKNAKTRFVTSVEVWLNTQNAVINEDLRAHWLEAFKADTQEGMAKILETHKFPLTRIECSIYLSPASEQPQELESLQALVSTQPELSVSRSTYETAPEEQKLILKQLCQLTILMEQLHRLELLTQTMEFYLQTDELNLILKIMSNIHSELFGVSAGRNELFENYRQRLLFSDSYYSRITREISSELGTQNTRVYLRVKEFEETLKFFSDTLRTAFSLITDDRYRITKIFAGSLPWHKVVTDLAIDLYGEHNVSHPRPAGLNSLLAQFRSSNEQPIVAAQNLVKEKSDDIRACRALITESLALKRKEITTTLDIIHAWRERGYDLLPSEFRMHGFFRDMSFITAEPVQQGARYSLEDDQRSWEYQTGI